MNSKQRRQRFNQLISSGDFKKANEFLWNTQFSIYCNQQYNHGKDAHPEEWFETLSNEKLEIVANEANYDPAKAALDSHLIGAARSILDRRLDLTLGIID